MYKTYVNFNFMIVHQEFYNLLKIDTHVQDYDINIRFINNSCPVSTGLGSTVFCMVMDLFISLGISFTCLQPKSYKTIYKNKENNSKSRVVLDWLL